VRDTGQRQEERGNGANSGVAGQIKKQEPKLGNADSEGRGSGGESISSG
jgi:hypothetical protein